MQTDIFGILVEKDVPRIDEYFKFCRRYKFSAWLEIRKRTGTSYVPQSNGPLLLSLHKQDRINSGNVIMFYPCYLIQQIYLQNVLISNEQ